MAKFIKQGNDISVLPRGYEYDLEPGKVYDLNIREIWGKVITKFSLNGKLSDMLSEARKNKLIERSVATDLHDFRENRNAYVHPEDRSTNFKVEDLRRWNSEIFELGKKEEEE